MTKYSGRNDLEANRIPGETTRNPWRPLLMGVRIDYSDKCYNYNKN